MRRVLVIAFHFPPEGGSSGVLRTLKFCKYLLEFGWLPVVLTVTEKAHISTDPKLMDQVPESVEVHRAWCVDSKRVFSIAGRYPELAAIPDRFLSWWPSGVWKGCRLIRSRACEAVFSTSPVPTAHMIALACKRICRIPWVADFRDPWIEDRKYSGFSLLRDQVERHMENWVLHRADCITVTTAPLRDEIIGNHPELARNKFIVLPNGYDEEDFKTLDTAEPARPESFGLVHTGLVNGSYRNPLPLLAAVRALIDESIISQDEIRVSFYGGGEYLNSSVFREKVQSLGLSQVVRVLDRVPYAESLARIRGAAALLIFQGGRDTANLIPAKAFEYVRSGRPILALTESVGSTAELIREFDTGIVVSIDDIADIKSGLVRLYTDYRSGKLTTRTDMNAFSRKYSRRSIAADLASVLSQLSRGFGPLAVAEVARQR